MNIHGHKQKVKLCLKLENYWGDRIKEIGARALKKANQYSGLKKYHAKQIRKLKLIKKESKKKSSGSKGSI